MAPPNPTGGESSTSGTRSGARTPTKGRLQLVVVKGAAPVKHVAFSTDDANKSAYKKNSNLIHANGKLMSVCCQQCLGALANWNDDNILGRGNRSFNELLSCMSEGTLGNGGTQCGRCVGLGKGGECCPPPKEAEPWARKVIAAAAEYNKILLANPALKGSQLTEDDKKKIAVCVAASKRFVGHLTGLSRSGKIASSPSKKRKAGESSSNDHMDLIGSTLRKGQGTLEEKMIALGDIIHDQNDEVRALRDQVQVLERRSVVDRARQRYLVDGMQLLIQAQAAAVEKANEQAVPGEEMDGPELPDFDITTMDFESDHEEDEDEE